MSLERPLVSVVTANYNGGRHLAPAVRSVLDQTLEDLELIVVDDGSRDDSLAVIAREAAGDPRVRVLVQPRNAGPAAARNRALDEARGRWIAVFDSDDVMAPDRLQRLVRRAQEDQAQIVVDNLLVFQDDAPEADQPFLPRHGFDAPRWIELDEYVARSRLYARGPGLGYLKPLFDGVLIRTSGIRYREDLRIGEDYDLVLRLLLEGARMRLEPAALYRYRKHATSISHALKREHILAMMAADADLQAQLDVQGVAVRRAQNARRASMRNALVYDRVIERLKAKDLAGGMAASLASPAVWPLLTMPVTARLKRLAERLKPAPGAQHAAA